MANSNIERIVAELARQAAALTADTDAVRANLSAVSTTGTDDSEWQAAAASVERLTVAAASAAITAAASGSLLLLEVLTAATPKQRAKLATAIETLSASLISAGATLAEALAVHWPAHLCSSNAIIATEPAISAVSATIH